MTSKTMTQLSNIFLFSLAFLWSSTALNAQDREVWSLQKCIDYANQNSLTIQLAENSVLDAQYQEKLAKLSRLPGVNGRATVGQQFGRTIDPTTNSFNNQRITFNSFNVDMNVNLFDGGRIHNSIRQAETNTQAAQLDRQVQQNNLALTIANTYLSILNAREQLENARTRLTLTQEQLEMTNKLIEAGSLPVNDRLDVLAQIARNEQTIVQARNQMEINYLTLYQLLEIPVDQQFDIEVPENLDIEDQSLALAEYTTVYNAALTTQPQIKLDKLNQESAALGVDIAKASYYPSLILFGGLNTNFSSAARVFIPDGTTVFGAPSEIIVNQQQVQVQFPQAGGTVQEVDYFDQLDQNFGQNFGLQLAVPIYNRGQNKIATQRATLAVLNAQLNARRNKQNLQTDVQTAVANARAAAQTLEAARKTYEASQLAYDNAQKRFDLGSVNTFDLTTAKNNLDTSEIDLTVAKYDYLFRLKIIDFYLGKELTLK